MKLEQRALRFPSAGVGLIAIVDVPERPLMRGLLILPDSSQYRAGSHRQFTLLSRLLAGRGIAVMRFDRRGYGDSEGDAGLGTVQAGEDIAAAMKEFFTHVPEMKEAVILAPGDAAPHAARYAVSDPRVAGLALLAPLLDPLIVPLLPAAPAQSLPAVGRAGARSAAERLFRRAIAFRSAAARAARATDRSTAAAAAAAAPAVPTSPPPVTGFGGRVLLVSRGSAGAGAGSTCALEHQGPRSRRVQVALCASAGGSAWREAVAFACASWLTSW